MFHFIKAACLLSFYRKYFNCSFWNSSPAWDKMLKTQKNVFYYFNLEKLGRLFPLGWLEWSYFTLRIILYFPSKAMSYSHTLFQHRRFCNSKEQYFSWWQEILHSRLSLDSSALALQMPHAFSAALSYFVQLNECKFRPQIMSDNVTQACSSRSFKEKFPFPW